MLGSSCSPCCGGCKNTYDTLLSKSCSITLGGDIPSTQGASRSDYTNSFRDSSGNYVFGFQNNATQKSEWSPERVAKYISFYGPITELTETSNWYVVAEQYRTSYNVNTIPDSTLAQHASFDKALVTSYKATQTPVGSHSLALDVGATYFSSTSGQVVFKKIADDYDITCTMALQTSGGACVVVVDVVVQSFYKARTFPYSVSPTFKQNSTTLTTAFLDSYDLPYPDGPRPENNNKRTYIPGTYTRQIAYLESPMYVQWPAYIPYFTQSYAQQLFDNYKGDASKYVSVWNQDLSISVVGSWPQGGGNGTSVGRFVATGRFSNDELTAGSVSGFSFVNDVAGLPTFVPSSTKPSPYSGTTLNVPKTSPMQVLETNPNYEKVPEVAFNPTITGEPGTTFHYNYKGFTGLTSTTLVLQ